MDPGLYLKGTHGVIQVDKNYRNHVVRATGTGTFSGSPNQGLGYLVDIVIPEMMSPTARLGISGNVPAAVANIAQVDGNVSFYGPGTGTFRWWVFDVLDAVATSGFGMWLKTETTHLPIWDSTRKPLRPVANVTIAGPGDASHGASYGVAGTYTGITLCFLNMSLAQSLYSGPSGGPGPVTNRFYIASLAQDSGTQAMFATVGRFTTFAGAPDMSQIFNGHTLLADITGFGTSI